jgi:undecaprenyl phosphate N,N'-diacetylbacillosamine 1-phosphate transferase
MLLTARRDAATCPPSLPATPRPGIICPMPAASPSAIAGPISSTLWANGLKRAVDCGLALVGAVLATPVLLLAIVATRLTSPGPAFFLQVRTGRGGREFRPFKLRTMTGGRRPDPKELVPLDHPDVTATGRLLRRLKIDELPQIYNVLLGDMALVGPRPTLPDQTQSYNEFQRQRLLVRPGLTGLAQINGNAATPWDERIKYDVYYVRHCGFWMDVAILLKTVLVVLRGEARYARPFTHSPYAKCDPAILADWARATATSLTNGSPTGVPR